MPGTIDPDDAPQWRQPWSCTPLGARTPDDQALFGTMRAEITVPRVATLFAALLVVMGAGFWVWQSSTTADHINGGLMCHPKRILAGARTPRTGVEELHRGTPRPHLGQSPLPHSQPHNASLQYPFVGALVVPQPVTRMSSWHISPSTDCLVPDQVTRLASWHASPSTDQLGQLP